MSETPIAPDSKPEAPSIDPGIDLDPKDELEYAASRLSSFEINGSFH